MHPIPDDRLAKELLERSTALLKSVLIDENGEIVAGRYVGGNGGSISRTTLQKAGPLTQTINEINERLAALKEG